MRAAIALVLSIAWAGACAGCARLAGLNDPQARDTDANGCNHDPCDLEDNCGCAAAQTCSWSTDNGASYCRDTAGSSARGDGCSSDDDCVLGTSCVAGECRTFCTGDPQCDSTICTADWNGYYPGITCADACTPITDAGCPGSSACLIIQGQDSAFCLNGGTLALGTDCTDNPFSCVPGAICHSETDAHVCRALCDPTGSACDAGTCTTASDLTAGGTQYGVCI